MKRIASYVTIAAAAVAAGFAFLAYAAIPQQINYQSRLRTSGGTPVTAATSISFSLYSAASGGTALWTEARNQSSGSCAKVAPDADGYFSVQLGSCASFPSSLVFDAALFLGVTVGSDAEATPRVPFSPSPYALNASRLGTFAGDPANSKVVAETTGTATAGTTGFNSSALTFRGSGWNGSSAQTKDVTIRNIVTSGSSSRLGIFNNAGTEIVSILDSGAIGVGVTNPIGAMEVVGDFYADRLLVRGGTVFNSFNASTNSDQTSFTRPRYFIGSATSTSDSSPKNLVQYEITGTTFLEDAAFSKLVSIANRQIKFGSNTLTFPSAMPTSNGQVLSGSTSGGLLWVDGSSGTVTSVGLALPNIFSVANSPITSSGTSTATLVSQTKNEFFAAPDGANGAPSFRAIVAADIPTLASSSIPNLDASKITTGTLAVARGGTGIGSFTVNSLIYASGATALGQIPIGSNGEVLTISGGVPTWSSLPAFGTVTSVGLVMNGGLFSVSGSPITGSGTSTASLIVQNPNKIFAGPQSGVSDAAPTFRDLVAADIPLLSSSSIPSIDASKVTTGIFGIGRIPDLSADKIVSGVFDIARIPNIPAANITGTLATSSIPNLDANKITSGTLPVARGGTDLSSYTANGVLYAPTSGTIGQVAAGSNGNFLTLSGGVPTWSALPASGTVTSAGIALPSSVFSVSGSPITSSGTSTATFVSQTAKEFFAAPNAADGTPLFRAILATDVPTLNQDTTGTASNITGILGAGSFPALTGDVTTASGSLVTTIGAGKVTNAMLAGSIDASKIVAGTSGQVLTTLSGVPTWADASAGTVTSVSLNAPSTFSVSGSPITGSGTLGFTWNDQAAREVFAGPIAGVPGAPGFRNLADTDIPDLSAAKITTGEFDEARIPALDATKIASGFIDANRIPTLDINTKTAGALSATRGGTGVSSYAAGDMLYSASNNPSALTAIGIGSTGEVLTAISGVPTWSSLPAFGTVTSVGLVMSGGLFSVSGSPITGSGTSTASLIVQNPNKVFAGPQSGVSDAAPTFRDLVAADIPTLATSSIPNLDANKITSGTLPVARGGTDLSSYTANGVLYAPTSSSIGQVAAGSNGNFLTLSLGVPTWSALPASGTVTSAGIALPSSVFSVSGSPITSSGTSTATFVSQTAKEFFAAPNAADGTPLFRAILATDVPTLNQNTTGTASNITGILGAGSFPALTGDVTTSAGSLVTTIGAGKVTNAMLAGSIDASKITSGTFSLSRIPAGADDQVLTTISGVPTWANGASGTVTSVGISVPSFLSVGGSPVTSSGTIAISIPNQNPNAIFAGPGSGASAAQPAFRALVAADIPNIDANKITSGTLPVARGGTDLSSYTANGVLYAPTSSSIGQVAAGSNGNFLTLSLGVPTWSALPASGDVSGIGTTSTIALFSGAKTIGNSIITQSGGNIDITSGSLSFAGTPRITGAGTATFATTTVSGTNLFTSNNVAIGGGSINGTTIGGVTPNTGTFSTLTSTGNVNVAISVLPTVGTAVIGTAGSRFANIFSNQLNVGATTTINGISYTWPGSAPANGTVLTSGASGLAWVPGASGTVTSAGLSLPNIFTVFNSPITSSGTTTASLATQVTKTFFAGPASGADAAPTFRAILATDVPTLNQNTTGTASNITGILGAGSFPALTGDVTTSAGSLVTTIGAGKVTNAMLAGSIDASKISSGTLPVARGGTDLSSYTANGVLYAPTSSSIGQVAAGSNGNFLTLSLGVPTWSALPASGDVSGIGTTSTIALFSGAKTIGNSIITQSGGNIDITSGSLSFAGTPRITGAGTATFATTTVSGTNLFTSNNVAIGGGSINGTTIGTLTQSVGAFSALTTTSHINVTTVVAPVLPTATIGLTGNRFANIFSNQLNVGATTTINGISYKWPGSAPVNGTVLTAGASGLTWAAGASGTVTSAGLTSTSSVITVAGSPITTNGTTSIGLATQNANIVLAGPVSGGSATPTFRALVAADIPGLATSSITSGAFSVARGGTGLSVVGADGQVLTVVSGAPAWAAVSNPTLTSTSNAFVLGGNSFPLAPSPAVLGTNYAGVLSLKANNIVGMTISGVDGGVTFPGNVSIQGGLTSSVVPDADNSRQLGSSGRRFQSIFANTLSASSTLFGNRLYSWPLATPTAGQVLSYGAGDALSWVNGASGTVTSVGITAPASVFATSSPVTASGNLGISLAVQNPNKVFAGPQSGASDAAPTFRTLVGADIPALATSSIASGVFSVARGGTGLGSFTANGVLYAPTASSIDQVAGGSNGNVLTLNASGVPAWAAPAAAGWGISGNTGTVDGTNFIGTTDNVPFTIRMNNAAAARFTGMGAVIGTGGTLTLSGGALRAFIGGGTDNTVSNVSAAVVGGFNNTASGLNSFVAGGNNNTASGSRSAIVGGNGLTLGTDSFGFSGNTANLSAQTNIAYFGDVDTLIGNTDNAARTLRFYEPNASATYTGANFTAFKAQAQGADITYTLPAAAPTVSGQALTATTAGVLSWATPASGVQIFGGTNTSVASSMPSTVSGSQNTAVGWASMLSVTSGIGNTAVGTTSLYGNTTGGYNTAIGAFGNLYSNTTGGYNVGVGSETMYSNISGSNNVAIGYAALKSNVSADQNVAIGNYAGTFGTGANNTAIGAGSGVGSAASASITNTTALGFGAETTKSNQVVIGNASVTETVLGGGILPRTDNTQDLGSLTKRWRDIYVGPASIKVVGAGGAVIETISEGTGANAGKLVVKGGNGVERQIGGAAAGNFIQGGNTFGNPAQIGTLDANGVNIFTNGTARLSIQTDGKTNFSEDATFAKAVSVGGAATFSGLIKIPSNAEAGRVLTSDNAGNATWQLPSAASCESPVFAGDKTIAGNLSVVGGISSDLIPAAPRTYNLGSAANPWRDIYVSSSTLKFVDDTGQVDATLSLTKGGDIVLENKETKTRRILGEGGSGGITGFASKVEDGQVTLGATAKDAAIGTEANAIDIFADNLSAEGLKIGVPGADAKGKALVVESVDAAGKVGTVGFASITDERVEPLVGEVGMLKSQLASLQAQFAILAAAVAVKQDEVSNACVTGTVPLRTTRLKGSGDWKITGTATPAPVKPAPLPVATPVAVPVPPVVDAPAPTPVVAAPVAVTQTKTATRLINIYGNPPSSDMVWNNIGNGQSQASNSASVTARKGQILSADGFDFSIPANAKIESISVTVSRRSERGTTADDTVYVLKGGALVGTDLATADGLWPLSASAMSSATFTLPTGSFGLTPGDLSGAFSVGIRPTLGGTDQATVGSVSVTVKYLVS